MYISYSNNSVSRKSSALNIPRGYKSMIILGKADSDKRSGEIINPKTIEEFVSIYDSTSDLFDAFRQAFNMGVRNMFVVNCYYDSDFLTITDELIHYDFTYIVPINLFLSDKFYDPIQNEQRYYADFFIEMLGTVDNLSTVVMTERNAALYNDMDSYLLQMSNVTNSYMNHITEYRKPDMLNKYGNNLIFTLNNIDGIEHANVILASQLCLSQIGTYPAMIDSNTVFDIDSIDLINYDMAYYKYNDLDSYTSIDNLVNMRKREDIYKNVLIDEVIKEVIRQMNLDEFKGKLYNYYTKLQINTRVDTIFSTLKGRIFKEYEIKNIGFIKTSETAGYIYVEASIIPYGTLEVINIAMGV